MTVTTITDQVSEAAENIAEGVWDVPAIETRDEFKAAISQALIYQRQVDRGRIEQLEQALDHLLELVDTIESQGILWREWFREVVEEARRAQAGGKVQDQ